MTPVFVVLNPFVNMNKINKMTTTTKNSAQNHCTKKVNGKRKDHMIWRFAKIEVRKAWVKKP